MMKDLGEFVLEKKYIVAAHRGASGVAPENTYPAFIEAIASGADMIEIDIQFSKDGKIVVYHDAAIVHTQDKISDLNFEEIKRYDIGSWFDKKFSNERIILLSDVIDFIRDKVYLSIEVKPEFSENTVPNLLRLLDILDKYNFKNNSIITSFDINNLIFLKSKDSEIYTAAIHLDNAVYLPSHYKTTACSNAFICSIDELDEKKIINAQKNDIVIGVYGVDDEATLAKALQHDVKVIGTDFPRKIVKYISNLVK